jgi:hypothetical protein
MLKPDLITVRRILIPASALVFVVGFLISGLIFFRGKPLDAKAAILSDLASPDENPHGYAASAAAVAISGILLIPVVSAFFGILASRRKLAWAGAAMFTVGLSAAIAIGFLAPVTHGYSVLHIQLAYAAFMGICGGTLIYLIAARASRIAIGLQGAVFLWLVYLYVGPDVFDNKTLLTSLAFWEWVLCVNCGVGLWNLAGEMVE